MYILFDEDGSVWEVDELPDEVSWDTWPKVVRITLYSGPDVEAFEFTENGWQTVKQSRLTT